MIITAVFKQDNEAFSLRVEYDPAQEAERAEASDKIAWFWGTVKGIYVDPLQEDEETMTASRE